MSGRPSKKNKKATNSASAEKCESAGRNHKNHRSDSGGAKRNQYAQEQSKGMQAGRERISMRLNREVLSKRSISHDLQAVTAAVRLPWQRWPWAGRMVKKWRGKRRRKECAMCLIMNDSSDIKNPAKALML